MEANWENLKLDANHAVGRGDFQSATDSWLKALEALDPMADHDPRVALTLDRLADTLCKADKGEQAVPVLVYCVELKERVLGSDHIELANTLNNLAELYYSMGRFAEGQPLSERIMSIYEQVFGREHLGLAMIASYLALIYHGQGNYDKAELLYKRALTIKQKVLGYNHSEVALLMENYAALLYQTNRSEEADNLCSNVGTASGLWKKMAAQTNQQLTQGSIADRLAAMKKDKQL
ncbi:MAG: tetratricopeptide repeat protein [Cyanobacteriota/Melainabacteria group bacterium]